MLVLYGFVHRFHRCKQQDIGLFLKEQRYAATQYAVGDHKQSLNRSHASGFSSLRRSRDKTHPPNHGGTFAPRLGGSARFIAVWIRTLSDIQAGTAPLIFGAEKMRRWSYDSCLAS